jgi:hypothetical protein
MKPLFVSFYTPDNGYAEEAAQLVETLKEFGLDHHVANIGKMINWDLATQHKPVFLLKMMRCNPGRSVVWVDADARVRKAPTLFESLDCDFAAHWRAGEELLSGTLYFSNSDASRHLALLWAERVREKPEQWDQVTLDQIVRPCPDWLRVATLPAPYTLIFDSMANDGPPVIEHTQASRRLKVHA